MKWLITAIIRNDSPTIVIDLDTNTIFDQVVQAQEIADARTKKKPTDDDTPPDAPAGAAIG